MSRLLRPLLLLLALMLAQAPFVHAHAGGVPTQAGWHLHLPRLEVAAGPVLLGHDGASTELPAARGPQREAQEAPRAALAWAPVPAAEAVARPRLASASRPHPALATWAGRHREGLPPPALAPPGHA